MMNIALSGDRNVMSGIELVIYSTMLHNKNIHWYILTMDCDVDDPYTGQTHKYYGLTDDLSRKWLEFLVNFMDSNSRITFVDCKELYLEHLDHSVNRLTGFTPFTALRLLADLFMPFDPEKPNPEDDLLLYLDADIIVQRELATMYYNTLKWDDDFAAYTLPDACNGFGEMIAAVSLFNVRHIRYSGLLNRARRNYNMIQYRFPDQSALSDAGKPVPLSESYNYMYDHKMATYTPHILHFSNGNRMKIYDRNTPEGNFWRYYPEHQYLKDGLDKVKEVFQNYFR